jgi:CsoR family transcriptional regulator, copper-sensing transcriptional repressor
MSNEREKIQARLGKAIGHLNHVRRMIDEKKYCIDVLYQFKAVQVALNKTAEAILKQHLETCVVDATQRGNAELVIEELLQVFHQAPSLYEVDEGLDQATAGVNQSCGL